MGARSKLTRMADNALIAACIPSRKHWHYLRSSLRCLTSSKTHISKAHLILRLLDSEKRTVGAWNTQGPQDKTDRGGVSRLFSLH